MNKFFITQANKDVIKKIEKLEKKYYDFEGFGHISN